MMSPAVSEEFERARLDSIKCGIGEGRRPTTPVPVLCLASYLEDLVKQQDTSFTDESEEITLQGLPSSLSCSSLCKHVTSAGEPRALDSASSDLGERSAPLPSQSSGSLPAEEGAADTCKLGATAPHIFTGLPLQERLPCDAPRRLLGLKPSSGNATTPWVPVTPSISRSSGNRPPEPLDPTTTLGGFLGGAGLHDLGDDNNSDWSDGTHSNMPGEPTERAFVLTEAELRSSPSQESLTSMMEQDGEPMPEDDPLDPLEGELEPLEEEFEVAGPLRRPRGSEREDDPLLLERQASLVPVRAFEGSATRKSHHKKGGRQGEPGVKSKVKKRAHGTSYKPAPGVTPGQQCSNCHTTSTPVWRAGPNGPKTLCNACGVRYMKTKEQKKR